MFALPGVLCSCLCFLWMHAVCILRAFFANSSLSLLVSVACWATVYRKYHGCVTVFVTTPVWRPYCMPGHCCNQTYIRLRHPNIMYRVAHVYLHHHACPTNLYTRQCQATGPPMSFSASCSAAWSGASYDAAHAKWTGRAGHDSYATGTQHLCTLKPARLNMTL